ncbi:uncharacterized protein PV06_11707 [Exophiala oligosperma]|uniref:Uncharacterized protein n=1 Tax=Exophiala oligosperma TaxID=215243 RepID=A0A0D2BET5_9EURO|nr:uncharacterized protein PV06_11707 [Exophiala oligosperma]KIW35987.1 hypothetical protein PV06_11707 [Exophiala oligosperma]
MSVQPSVTSQSESHPGDEMPVPPPYEQENQVPPLAGIEEQCCNFGLNCESYFMSTQVLMDVKLFFGTQNSQNQVSWTQYGTGFRISVANEMYTKHAFMSQLIGCMKSRYSAHSEMEKFSNLTFELSARESDIDNETIFDVTWFGETHPECVLRHYGFQANNPTSDGQWDGELGPHVWQIAVFAHESSESSPWGLKSHLQPGKALQSFTLKRSSKRRNDRLAQRLYRILRANTRMFKGKLRHPRGFRNLSRS